MTIKMIASDMDGTFLSGEDSYNEERFAKDLAQLKEKGIRFVAASGRQVANLKKLFEPMKAHGLFDQIDFVSSNGSVVTAAGQELYAVYLSADQIRKVIDWNALNPKSADNVIVLAGVNGTYISNHVSPEFKDMLSMFYPNVTQVEKLLEIDDKILGVSFVWPHEEVQEHVAEIEKLFGHEIHVTGSGFGSVDVLPKNVDKAAALEVLQDYYNVGDHELMVFGDNTNDLEMLTKYDNAYLMPNASKIMHEANAHHQLAVKANVNDGVLATIEEKFDLN
ncbi:HAD-IIB family hydrolase [Fructobacillus ficulneus]|uniref:HAD superfamily hydrolase n=1 Tax=Fructobacillus ficulneus TaxID=157463 RepID=A0A0K8MGN4_9LACO|nr:HAD family hydrolase [Fructobacillus ficulneus]GAO99358.1 HAD superfamily hydrolase [Fructobacillus ficulneus]